MKVKITISCASWYDALRRTKHHFCITSANVQSILSRGNISQLKLRDILKLTWTAKIVKVSKNKKNTMQLFHMERD